MAFEQDILLHPLVMSYKAVILTLFRPGGGGAIVPALTLEVYNNFHKQAKVTKLGDFS